MESMIPARDSRDSRPLQHLSDSFSRPPGAVEEEKIKKPAPISRSGPFQIRKRFYFAAAAAASVGASTRAARLILAALPLRLRR